MPNIGPVELLLMLIIGLIVVGGLFVVVVGATRALFGRGRRLESELGIDVLDARLARGEITREEYAIARRALGR